MSSVRNSSTLNSQIIACTTCRRLRTHCQKIQREKKKAFADWEYWGRPVPNFGDPQARLLIVGLAPAAHGANRTGRMFTGDRSGDWLYRALHKAGFANQPLSSNIDDGLQLKDALITAVAHCAPPGNKPLPRELQNCSDFLKNTFQCTPFQVVLALGKIAWDASWTQLDCMEVKKPAFTHGQKLILPNGRLLLGSYHPSQQNTFTGRLTESMFDSVFSEAKIFLERTRRTRH